MQRTNIYLDEDQLRLLKHLAAEENKPVADLGGGLAPAKLTPAISLAGVLTISRFFRNRSV